MYHLKRKRNRRINVGAEAGAERDEVKEKPSAKWNKGRVGASGQDPILLSFQLAKGKGPKEFSVPKTLQQKKTFTNVIQGGQTPS